MMRQSTRSEEDFITNHHEKWVKNDNTPKKISDELAKFLGKQPGTLMTLNDAGKEINTYIRSNPQKEKNGMIIPDQKLKQLFKLDGKMLTKSNIRHYLEKHLSDPEENSGDIFGLFEPFKTDTQNTKIVNFDKFVEEFGASNIVDEEKDEDEDVSSDEEDSSSVLPEQPEIPIENINLCFVGGVSTGKSTILNAIFCEELTQCKIKRTTMTPTIYVENEDNSPNLTSPDLIFKTISCKNAEIIEKSEAGKKIDKKEYEELKFNVGKLDINILEGSYVNVYDIPGLNDARTKDIYYSYLEENFIKFNLVVLLVDIHSGLNTSDEIDIVNFVTSNTRYQLEKNNKKIYTLVVVNKADDMQLDEEDNESDKLIITGELSEMFEQVENTITSEFTKHNIVEHLIGIIPLCAIDSYLYRMIRKHGKKFKLSPQQILKIGVNENGKKFSTLKPATQEKRVYEILTDTTFIDTMIKLSGFKRLENLLHKFLNENETGKEIKINNLLFELGKLENISTTIERYISIKEIAKAVEKHIKLFNMIKKIDVNIYLEHFSEFIKLFEISIEEKIRRINFDKKSEILDFYDEINCHIIKSYFNEFIETDNYPEYIKSLIYTKILYDFQDKFININTLIENFLILQNAQHFIKSIVQTLIEIIIKNRLGSCSLEFPLNYFDVKTWVQELIEIINACHDIEVNNLPQFLRFILINSYASNNIYKTEDLMRKLMLFKRYGEIPMYSYLMQYLTNKEMDISVFIYGLGETDITENTQDGLLELFYIEYEKKHSNGNNFVISQTF